MDKIAYVIGQLSVGGTERQLLTLVEHLDRRQFSPLVISLSSRAPLADSFRQIDCPLYVLEREQSGRFNTLWRVYQIVREFRPDIVHTFAYAARAGIPAAKLAGSARTILSIRTDPYWQMSFWDRWLIRQADVLLANSRQSIQTLVRNGTALPAHRVIHNGIALPNLNGRRKNFGAPIPDQAVTDGTLKIICAVARLDVVKALDVLIRAYAQVHSEFPATQLWLVGDGPQRAKLEQLAENLGVRDRVVFWGLRSDVSAILNHAALGALSSHVEGLPNAIIEYMAAGLPVVATNVGGVSELVVQDETGILVSPNDSLVLSQAILFLLHNPTAACQFGVAGRQHAQDRFTAGRMVKETQLLYNEILAK